MFRENWVGGYTTFHLFVDEVFEELKLSVVVKLFGPLIELLATVF